MDYNFIETSLSSFAYTIIGQVTTGDFSYIERIRSDVSLSLLTVLRPLAPEDRSGVLRSGVNKQFGQTGVPGEAAHYRELLDTVRAYPSLSPSAILHLIRSGLLEHVEYPPDFWRTLLLWGIDPGDPLTIVPASNAAFRRRVLARFLAKGIAFEESYGELLYNCELERGTILTSLDFGSSHFQCELALQYHVPERHDKWVRGRVEPLSLFGVPLAHWNYVTEREIDRAAGDLLTTWRMLFQVLENAVQNG